MVVVAVVDGTARLHLALPGRILHYPGFEEVQFGVLEPFHRAQNDRQVGCHKEHLSGSVEGAEIEVGDCSFD